MQRQKTDDTLFMECQFFKNRMLRIYKGLEEAVLSRADRNVSGTEKAKAAEVAANIATNILTLEREEIKAIKQLLKANNNGIKEGQKVLENLGSQSKNNESDSIKKEYDPNRKF